MSFRLIDPDEAVAIGCLLVALAAFGNFFVDEPAPQPAVQTARACPDQWIAQSGPEQMVAPVCVVVDLTNHRELPPHILTMPIGQ